MILQISVYTFYNVQSHPLVTEKAEIYTIILFKLFTLGMILKYSNFKWFHLRVSGNNCDTKTVAETGNNSDSVL